MPAVNPVTVIGDADPLACMAPGDDVTTYDVGKPPDVAGVNAIDAEPLLYALPEPASVAVTPVGVCGGADKAIHPCDV